MCIAVCSPPGPGKPWPTWLADPSIRAVVAQHRTQTEEVGYPPDAPEVWLLRVIAHALGYAAGACWRLAEDQQQAVITAAFGPHATTLLGRRQALSDPHSLVGTVIRTGQPSFHNHLQQGPHDAHPVVRQLGYQAALCVPLIGTTGDILGAMTFWDIMRPDRFTESDLYHGLLLGTLGAHTLEVPQLDPWIHQVETWYRALLESLREAVYVVDWEGLITYANAALEKLTGYQQVELLGQPSALFHDPALVPGLAERRQRALAGEASLPSIEVEIIRKDGRQVFTELSANNLMWQGRPIGRIVMLRDLTTRQQVQAHLATILTIIPDAVITIGVDQRIVSINHGGEELFGYQAHELIGQPLDRLLPPRFAERHRQHVRAFAAAPEHARMIGKRGVVTGRRRDGREFPAEASIAKLVQNGTMLLTVILRDISTRQRLEEELRQAQKMEAVGRLAGGIAHDFNNLLTVITGRSSLLLRDLPPTFPGYRGIQMIQETADRAATLTRQLLAFSRRQVLQLRPLDLNAVVDGIRSMLQRLIMEDIELVMVMEPALGLVYADQGQVEQVLLNLAVNARDAMPQGGQLIIETANLEVGGPHAQQPPDLPPGPYVRLVVRDTGSGMDAETMAHLFEPFFTTKELGRGTGLGLAVVYGIITQSGGRISVESAPGQGTMFTIYLPRVLGDTPRVVEIEATEPGPPRGQETILLAEDSVDVRELASEILQSAGYHVLEATTPQEALRQCEQHRGRIDLLLTDVIMPEMSGPRLADQIVRIHPSMKVLYISGYPDDALGHHGVPAAGTMLLEKPFTPAELVKKVREALDANASSPPVSEGPFIGRTGTPSLP